MLKFAVYDNSGPAHECDLTHAHLVGVDEVPTAGEVTFKDGVITCERRSSDSTAICLLTSVEGAGRIMLPTCLLPARERPYLLSLEQARHRIKMFLVKLEDWMLYDLDPAHPVMAPWEEARQFFTQASILEHSEPAKADQLAKRALERAFFASEQLALMHADIMLAKRFAAEQMPRRALGCVVHQSKFAEPLTKVLTQSFEFLSIPIRWREVEPEEGEYDWGKLDRWMEWAASAKMPVVAGPIIDFRKHAVPEWLYVWEHDYDTTHDLLHEHIEAVVRRYKSTVSVWNVASSLHINENFTLAYDQLMDATRMALTLVKSLHSGARTMVEITEPFGEYFASNPRSVPPAVYADVLAQSGFKLDMIGLAFPFGVDRAGMATRDLMQVSAMLDRYLGLDFPLVVSGLGVPGSPHRAEKPEAGGYWHKPWSGEVQAECLAKLAGIALSKPFVNSLAIHEFYDHPGAEAPGTGLITSTGRAKPGLARMADIRKEIAAGSLTAAPASERHWTIDPERPEGDLIRV